MAHCPDPPGLRPTVSGGGGGGGGSWRPDARSRLPHGGGRDITLSLSVLFCGFSLPGQLFSDSFPFLEMLVVPPFLNQQAALWE